MEEKALRLSAVFLMILTAVSFVLLPKLPALHTWEVEAREERIAEEEFAQSQVTMQNLKIKEQNEAAGAKGELSIRLPEGVTGDQIAVSNDYVTQTIRVEIPQADRTYFDSYPVLGNSDYIDGLSYTRQGETGVIEVTTNKVYELQTEYDTQNFYFNFLTPHEVYDKVSDSATYDEFIRKYTEQYVYEQDRQKLRRFLTSKKLTEHLVDGCMEDDMSYRRICDNEADSYIWMEAKRYVDETENIAILTLHNAKVIPDTIVNMEQELRKKEKNITKQYWDMVSLLVAVLNHNNLVEKEHQDDISFYTEQVYRQLQKNYPEYGITEEEIENVSHLAPIHDIGKIRVPIEILNKNGKLTIDEMEVVKQHPITGAEMTLRFPNGMTTEKLNKYSYEICRHHHERFDGSGYPDGLKGDQIPLCAQVVGLVDAYDALVSERP